MAADLDDDDRTDLLVTFVDLDAKIFWNAPLSSRQDRNNNGQWDACDPDCNKNKIPDDYEILQGLGEDLDRDGDLDACEQAPFVRGDLDADGFVGISDPIAVFNWSFDGASAPANGCLDAADFNDDGRIDTSDPVFSLEYYFDGGRAPPPPFPEGGHDPTPDGIDCNHYAPAAALALEGLSLSFEGCPAELSGSPGDMQTFEVSVVLLTPSLPRGASGWSIGIAAENLKITGIELAGPAGSQKFAALTQIVLIGFVTGALVHGGKDLYCGDQAERAGLADLNSVKAQGQLHLNQALDRRGRHRGRRSGGLPGRRSRLRDAHIRTDLTPLGNFHDFIGHAGRQPGHVSRLKNSVQLPANLISHAAMEITPYFGVFDVRVHTRKGRRHKRRIRSVRDHAEITPRAASRGRGARGRATGWPLHRRRTSSFSDPSAVCGGTSRPGCRDAPP